MHVFNTPYLHFCLSPDSKTAPRYTLAKIDRHMTCFIREMWFVDCSCLSHAHSLVSIVSWQLPAQCPSSLPCQFYVCLCNQSENWPTWCQPCPFDNQAEQPPCAPHLAGDPTHLLLSCPFCWHRTYTPTCRSVQCGVDSVSFFIPHKIMWLPWVCHYHY